MDFVLWIFVHDLNMKKQNPFLGVGLRENDGTPKGLWFAWKELKEGLIKKNREKIVRK